MNIYRVHAYNTANGKVATTQVEVATMDIAIASVMRTLAPEYKLLKVQFLNEYKNWETHFQVAYTPVDGRMETGTLKINDDWCGYFLRGDNACGLAFDANEIEEWFTNLPEEHRKGIWIQMNSLLASLKDMASCRNK